MTTFTTEDREQAQTHRDVMIGGEFNLRFTKVGLNEWVCQMPTFLVDELEKVGASLGRKERKIWDRDPGGLRGGKSED